MFAALLLTADEKWGGRGGELVHLGQQDVKTGCDVPGYKTDAGSK